MTETQLVEDLQRLLRQSVFLDQRQHSHLDRCKRRRKFQHGAGIILHLFFIICITQHGQEHPVAADGCLYHERYIALVQFRIKEL